jgi:uncharacterized protein (TIGR02466 family)
MRNRFIRSRNERPLDQTCWQYGRKCATIARTAAASGPGCPKLSAQIDVLFPTLLGISELPEAAALNRELEDYVGSREAHDRDQSGFTTVFAGWQSGLDFLEADVPAVHRLKRFINERIEAFLAEWGRVSFVPGAPPAFRYSYTGWAVVLRPGGFQHQHVHTKTDVTGIYYVAVPDASGGESLGDLVLTDPRAGRVAARSMWESAQHRVRPKPGMLLLFPSFVPHHVDQVQAPGRRISVNFDVTLQGVS